MGLLVYAWGPLAASPSGDSDPTAQPTSRRPLPSIDPACLAAIAFLSLANANFHVIESNDPALSESGALPVVRDETAFFHGLDQVLARKSDRSLALDADLSPAQRADALAIKALVIDKLADLLHYAWYIHPPNSTTTSRRFQPLLSLPARWMHMRSMRKAAVLRINARAAHDWTGPLLLGPVHQPTVRLTPTAAVSASEVAARVAAEESVASAAARRRSSGMSTSAATFGTGARDRSRTASDLGRIPEDSRRPGGDTVSDLSIRSATSKRTTTTTAAAPVGTFHPPTISLDDDLCVQSMDDTLHGARRVYTTLVTLLGDRPFLLGDQPHSLDAVVFGYLALHYYPILPDDHATPAAAASDAATDPRTLASLMLTDFPTLVAYLDRVYAAARIDRVQVERPLPTISRMLWTTAKDTLLRVPRALSPAALKRSGILYTLGSVAAGVTILAAYSWVVKANEARRVAEAVQFAQAVARQKKLEARKAQVGGADVDENDSPFAGSHDDEYHEVDDDEFFDDEDDD